MLGQGAHCAPSGELFGVGLKDREERRTNFTAQIFEYHAGGERDHRVANILGRNAVKSDLARTDQARKCPLGRVFGGDVVVTGHRHVNGVTRKSGDIEHLGELICGYLPVRFGCGTRAGAATRGRDDVRINNAKIRAVWGVETDLGLIRVVGFDIEPIVALGLGLPDVLVAAFFVYQL